MKKPKSYKTTFGLFGLSPVQHNLFRLRGKVGIILKDFQKIHIQEGSNFGYFRRSCDV